MKSLKSPAKRSMLEIDDFSIENQSNYQPSGALS